MTPFRVAPWQHERGFSALARNFSVFFCIALGCAGGLIPAGLGWVLTEARDINESGQIVGTAWRNGEQRGFVLTPL